MISKDQENIYVVEFWDDDIEEGLEDPKEFGLLINDFGGEYRLMKELLTKISYVTLAEVILEKFQNKEFEVASSYEMGDRLAFRIEL